MKTLKGFVRQRARPEGSMAGRVACTRVPCFHHRVSNLLRSRNAQTMVTGCQHLCHW